MRRAMRAERFRHGNYHFTNSPRNICSRARPGSAKSKRRPARVSASKMISCKRAPRHFIQTHTPSGGRDIRRRDSFVRSPLHPSFIAYLSHARLKRSSGCKIQFAGRDMSSLEQRGSGEHGNGRVADGEPGAGTETHSPAPSLRRRKRAAVYNISTKLE